MRLQTNNPLKNLTTDNDLFGTVPKAESIISIIRNFPDSIGTDESNKILALYGTWGSGKTTLLLHMAKQLTEFKFIFFETWKYEQDGNLALSLLDCIVKDLEGKKTKALVKSFLIAGASLMKNLAKSVSFSIGPIGISGKDFISELEKDFKKNGSLLSFHKRLKNFTDEYQKIETMLLKESKKDRIIVFIDDLDRCEPENVLNLLVALKHFFSHGKKTIFFCGIDKEAVSQAIEVRYSKVIQADEYLEKIIDINFNMPKEMNTNKLLLQVFNNKTKYYPKLIASFFKEIGFTNPRKIKKVMNKYLLIRHILEKKLYGYELIPDQHAILNVIIVLFMIVLYEFYSKEYIELTGLDEKKRQLFNKYRRYVESQKIPISVGEIKKNLNRSFPSHGEKLFDLVKSELDAKKKFVNFFLNIPAVQELNIEDEIDPYLFNFNDNSHTLQAGFCYFYIQNFDSLVSKYQNESNYEIMSLFKMAETIL